MALMSRITSMEVNPNESRLVSGCGAWPRDVSTVDWRAGSITAASAEVSERAIGVENAAFRHRESMGWTINSLEGTLQERWGIDLHPITGVIPLGGPDKGKIIPIHPSSSKEEKKPAEEEKSETAPAS